MPWPLQVKLKSLDDEIASGAYGEVGSTKARLVKPLRKALAKDRLGPGERLPGFSVCVQHAVPWTLHSSSWI